MVMENLLKFAMQLEEKRVNATLSGDADQLASLLSDEVSYGHSLGYREDKNTYMQKFRDGVYTYQHITFTTENAVMAGGGAFITHSSFIMNMELGGMERIIKGLSITVWRNEDGTWRIIAGQTVVKSGHVLVSSPEDN